MSVSGWYIAPNPAMSHEVICDDCNERAHLRRTAYGNLLVCCGCNEKPAPGVKVSKRLPDEWQA